MRHWIFHPLIFYPLVALIAVLVVAVSLKPQAWPRAPAAVSGEQAGPALVYRGEAFNAPALSPTQNLWITRDLMGRAQTMRIALLPNLPPPGPDEQGARILLSPEDGARLSGRAAVVEVSYNPLPINVASGLAVSLQGSGPTRWIEVPAAPQTGVLRFELPPQASVNAIGLRALSSGTDQAYGLEITRIRVTPRA